MKTTTTLGNARPLLLALCLWLLFGGSARSQEFTVSSFRLLPNDASGFVNSVRDLNDEPTRSPSRAMADWSSCLRLPRLEPKERYRRCSKTD